MTLLVSIWGEQVNLDILNFSHIFSVSSLLSGVSNIGPAKADVGNMTQDLCIYFYLQRNCFQMCAFTFSMQYKCFFYFKIPVSLCSLLPNKKECSQPMHFLFSLINTLQQFIFNNGQIFWLTFVVIETQEQHRVGTARGH